jgi:hypothetical protein
LRPSELARATELLAYSVVIGLFPPELGRFAGEVPREKGKS